jgi:hypothetical protein
MGPGHIFDDIHIRAIHVDLNVDLNYFIGFNCHPFKAEGRAAEGATTLSITTFSIITLSRVGLFATLSIDDTA